MKSKHSYLYIGGKRRPFSLGLATLELYSERTGTKLMDLNLETFKSDMTLDKLITLVYCGLVIGTRMAGQKNECNRSQVSAWLDRDPSLLKVLFDRYMVQDKPKPKNIFTSFFKR